MQDKDLKKDQAQAEAQDQTENRETDKPEQSKEAEEAGNAASNETADTAKEQKEASEPGDGEAGTASCKEEEDMKAEHQKEEKQADAESRQVAELKDKYARLYAEFDNYRKRTDREKTQMYDMGARMVVEKILPVVDNFERALRSIPDDTKGSAFAEGVDRIYRQIQKTFDEMGVKPIEAVGNKFDPNFHNAVMTETEGDAEEDVVTEDLQRGYTYKGEVVRHSMVKVKK